MASYRLINVPKTTLPYTLSLEFLFTNTFLVGRVCKGNQKVRRDVIGKICKYCGKLLNTANVLSYHFKIEGKIIILAIVEKTPNLKTFFAGQVCRGKDSGWDREKIEKRKKALREQFCKYCGKELTTRGVYNYHYKVEG
jgi:hypothetical protein